MLRWKVLVYTYIIHLIFVIICLMLFIAFFTYICMVWCSFIFFQMKLIRSPNDQLLSIAPSRGCPTTFLKAWGWVTAQWILYFSNEQLRFNAFVHHLCAKVFFSARKGASQFEPGLWQSFLQRLVCRRPPPAEPTPRDSRWTCGALVRICSHSVQPALLHAPWIGWHLNI